MFLHYVAKWSLTFQMCQFSPQRLVLCQNSPCPPLSSGWKMLVANDQNKNVLYATWTSTWR